MWKADSSILRRKCHNSASSRMALMSAAIALAQMAFSALPAAAQNQPYTYTIGGATARAIWAHAQGGGRWCYPEMRTRDPATGAERAESFRCVSRILGQGQSPQDGTIALLVEFGNEINCYQLPGTSIPQIVATIDHLTMRWHGYLQNLRSVCDPYAYANDLNYRAQCENWVTSEANRGAYEIARMGADREAYLRCLASGAGGAGAPGSSGGGGAGSGGGSGSGSGSGGTYPYPPRICDRSDPNDAADCELIRTR